MKLAALSIYRVGHRKVPHVPTREERMQAYYATRPVQFANTHFPHPARHRNPPKGRAGPTSRQYE